MTESIALSGIVLRGKKGWIALCLEYDIAHQAESPVEAVEGCIEATASYLKSFTGEGQNLKEALRPAPFYYRLLYHWYALRHNLKSMTMPRYFSEPLRLSTQ